MSRLWMCTAQNSIHDALNRHIHISVFGGSYVHLECVVTRTLWALTAGLTGLFFSENATAALTGCLFAGVACSIYEMFIEGAYLRPTLLEVLRDGLTLSLLLFAVLGISAEFVGMGMAAGVLAGLVVLAYFAAGEYF